jgi:lipopolysaccharide export system ATP-binding protein
MAQKSAPADGGANTGGKKGGEGAPGEPGKKKLLAVENLVKIYGRRRVVDKVSFDVEPGEIVGLLGPNGAGKTTTFLMTVGMVTPESGSILFKGKDVTRLPMFKRAHLGIGYLAQEPSIFRRLTVEENILAILETRKLSRHDRAARLEELLAELDLARIRKNRADTLSGGERRRLEITRALVTNPSLILLDEPFAGVDPIAVADVQEIVQKLSRRGIGVLLTDHNVRETLSITNRAYIIYEGKIIERGSAPDLIRNQLVRKVYLGERFDMPGVGISTEEERGLEETSPPRPGAPHLSPPAAPDPAPAGGKPAFTEGVSHDEVKILGSPLFENVRDKVKGGDEKSPRGENAPPGKPGSPAERPPSRRPPPPPAHVKKSKDSKKDKRERGSN